MGHKVFFCDVGLRLKNKKQQALTKLRMALPFGTDKESLHDLHDIMLDQSAAMLIFGKPVMIDGSAIDSGQGRVLVAKVSNNEAKLHTELSNLQKGYSLWTINVSPALKKDEECYTRVRFELRSLGRVWVWKRSGLSKTGALVDIRVADVRQSVSVWRELEDQIVPIQGINVFVISPASLQFRSTSPPFHYMRILEGRVWEPYLGRASDLMRRGKLVIFQWRNNPNVDPKIDPTCPFRVFLDLSREFGLLPLSNHLLVAAMVLLGLFIAYSVRDHAKELMAMGVVILERFGLHFTVLAAFGFVFWLIKNFGPIQKAMNVLKRLFLNLERFVYKA